MLHMIMKPYCSDAYISNFALDPSRPVLYITENDLLYEIDAITYRHLAVYQLGAPSVPDSLFIRSNNNQHTLYFFREVNNTNRFEAYSLPLRSPLQPSKVALLAGRMTMRPAYSNNDSLVVLSLQRNITLFDLDSFTTLDTRRFFRYS